MSTEPKSFKQKAIKEIKTVAIATIYFAIWLGHTDVSKNDDTHRIQS